MSDRANYLAFDLGAESGRAVLGRFDGELATLEEVHRFPNTPVKLSDGLHWDVLRIFAEMKEGLAKAATRVGEAGLHGIGVDTWAVDFGLLDRDGALVGNPYHHRDGRTEGMLEEALRRLPREEMYRTTGIQFLRINTVYQLLAMENSPLLGVGETLLMIPDLLNYWLTGEKACEFTNATTTQLLDLETNLIHIRAFPYSHWSGRNMRQSLILPEENIRESRSFRVLLQSAASVSPSTR